MKLASPTGDSVELTIGGYEYGSMSPQVRGDWDANWLMISGEVNDFGETWEFRDPCLTTWEAHDLLRFLRKPHAVNGDPLEFTEPNLTLQATATDQQTVAITFTFRGEAAAPSTSDDDRWDTGRAVVLSVSRESLRLAGDEWARQLKRYPER